ncbi:LlaJI family restriction endonuclease [Bacillus paralicheniformis]|uniref:LlaJI family restriction endonuclease n=1 Tax=Bacillus paralicheniformis TaxID=1648923 RepID=UPI00241156AC|nr:LlaJI family restriction endonuclease [Bacillus paralicheniformis]MED1715663.1 LlaJI family restriction endonuclease [Bacillus paralicheniformis]WFF94655.1 LlaJI family restriction endonuclease [Bacillus paralicheniformis]
MEIISEYVREQNRYSKSDLKQIFHFSTDEVEGFIKNLKAFGILKAVKNNSEQRELSDLINEDIEIVDMENGNDNYLYVFTYVGVITIGSRIIKCYPKYLLSENAPIDEMKQILKVISRYGSKEQIINLYNGDEENSSFNILAVILFLLNDFYEYGIYKNSEDIVEINGEGEILWDKTISESFTLVSNNRPYYMELYTSKTVDDEFDFFKRLHECILTECSQQLETSDLIDLFDIEAVNLSEEVLDDFGDTDYILYRLHSELNIQFNTRKQALLKSLYAYIVHSRTSEGDYGISMYGTNSFNLVWEDVCSEVFNNKLQTNLGQLDLPVTLADGYNASDKLIDIIEKPIWIGNKMGGETFDKPAKETLIPDLITIWRQDDSYQFIIFDAKYYTIQLEEGKQLLGQPGVGDVTKQYLYQLAYKDFISDHHINEVRNCFLMPTEQQSIIVKGYVSIEMLHALGLQNIQIRQLPAELVYSHYLANEKMDIGLLQL